MNHLPLPSEAIIEQYRVHFLADQFHSEGSFDDYPNQHGWILRIRNRSIEFEFEGRFVQDEMRIGKFLQEWLYFGLLREFGFTTNADDFIKQVDSGANLLTSACLADLVPHRLQAMRIELKSMTDDDFESRAIHLKACLQRTWTTLRWLVPSANPLIADLCLSIAVLGETLENLLMVIVEESPISLAVSVPWRIQPECDFGRPLLKLMQKRGWCLHRLAHLDRDGNDSIGRLWYFANIRPPLHDRDHEDCSLEQCRHLQIDPSTYGTAHESAACRCDFYGPHEQKLAEIVRAGKIPVVSLEDKSVHVREASEDVPFVAISHVWADGMGNQISNTLPWCILRRLHRCVNEAIVITSRDGGDGDDNIPFWIDTLCLPRQPIELRRQGIANLSESFKQAQVVLVIDTHLNGLDPTAMTPTEIVAHIASSNWTLRLWTFSEGRLARRILFQFQGQALEPKALVSDMEDQPIPSDTIASSVMMEILRTYNATTTFDAMDVTSPAMLRSSLKTRSTSWKSDEALCLGYILGLDMKVLARAEDNMKMQTFWSLIGPIPLGLAFSDAKTKIDTLSYRWAPASLTGDLGAEIWLGPASHHNKFASLAPSGLMVDLPSLFFTAERHPSIGNNSLTRTRLVERLRPPEELLGPLEFKHANGDWYHCIVEAPWHQNPRPYDLFDNSKLAILLATGLDKEPDGTSASLHGLLVTFSGTEAHPLQESPPQAQVHFHVSINRYTERESEYMANLQTLANNLRASHAARIGAVLDDRVAAFNVIWDICRSDGGIFDEGFIEVAKRVHRERGIREDVPSLVIYCCDYIVWLLRVGPYYEIGGGEQNSRWCID